MIPLSDDAIYLVRLLNVYAKKPLTYREVARWNFTHGEQRVLDCLRVMRGWVNPVNPGAYLTVMLRG